MVCREISSLGENDTSSAHILLSGKLVVLREQIRAWNKKKKRAITSQGEYN